MKNVAKVAEVWRAQLEGQAGLAPDEKAYSPFLFHQAQRSGLILEVGAGRGRMAKVLKQNGISATLVGLDLNAEVREGPCLPVKGDARSLPFSSNSFDLVYSLDVVEHFPETDRALAEQVRILKKGGQVLVTPPPDAACLPRCAGWYGFSGKESGRPLRKSGAATYPCARSGPAWKKKASKFFPPAPSAFSPTCRRQLRMGFSG